ncbi:FecR family protein [Aestuariibaculum sediminum]|uniref:FecR family protein n=1 Tax=Aestuariibaculum sediminum TaxID=2770637 RepID=A0A8J6U930_9FLAO|nr:FecR family protein [Aestuariibaculum sediminum]MBD0833670.1 FecR family protein [Aestuariibaculum sediminum]
MEEKEIRKLLKRSAEGKATQEEQVFLDRLVSKKLKDSENISKHVTPNKEQVLKNTLANIKFRKRLQAGQNFMKYAAVILLCLTVGYTFFYNTTLNTEQQVKSFVEVYTQQGERKTITLPDHSTLVLNANSYCKYPENFPNNNREVELKGEGFFNVSHDKSKPFIVKTKDLNTTVLGTSFNIKEDTLNVSVTVSTGCVRVDQANYKTEAAILVKDKQYLLDLTTNTSLVSQVNSEALSDWSRNIISFNNRELPEVLTLLEQWYGVTINNKSNNLNGRTLNGKYQNKSIKYVLDDLKFMFDIDYKIQGNNIIITE